MNSHFIRTATNKKLTSLAPWYAQENNNDIIDLSLCAGQISVPGKDDNQFAVLAEPLNLFLKKLASLFPVITFAEKAFLHSTLLTLFNADECEFHKNKPALLALSKDIVQEFSQYRPFIINFQDLVLTSNGSIILLGKSPEVMAFRNHIYNRYPTDEALRKNIIHITVGRLLQDATIENMSAINRFLQENGHLSLPAVEITYPKFIVSRDSLCLTVDTALSSEFNAL